jgi:hypothetical protein
MQRTQALRPMLATDVGFLAHVPLSTSTGVMIYIIKGIVEDITTATAMPPILMFDIITRAM